MIKRQVMMNHAGIEHSEVDQVETMVSTEDDNSCFSCCIHGIQRGGVQYSFQLTSAGKCQGPEVL